MPHQCTDCGRAFDDGSKEMLSGCPDCGGNKFQFKPDGYNGSEEPSSPPEPPEPEMDSSVARTVGNAATAVRDLVGSRSRSSPADGSSTQNSDPLHHESDTVESYHSDSNSSDPLHHKSDPTRTGFSSGPESRVADTEGPPRPDTESPPRSDTEKLARPDTESPPRPDTEKLSGPDTEKPSRTEREDSAQVSARSEIVSRDELPPAPDRFQSAPPVEKSGGTGHSRPAGEPSTRPQTTGSADRFGSSQSSGSKESKRTDRKRTGETERQAEHPSESRPDRSDQSPVSHSDGSDQPSESSSDSATDASESRPDLSELRAELNDQFESIRVLEPGQYELNLMELFDREEYIVALQEDGKYTIQVPERWHD